MSDSSSRFIESVRASRAAALIEAARERGSEPLYPAPERRRHEGMASRVHVMVAAMVALSSVIVFGLLAAMRAPSTVCVEVSWPAGAAALAGAATAGAVVVAVLGVRKE